MATAKQGKTGGGRQDGPRRVKVKALVEVRDDGALHRRGETFEMEASLVEAHVRTGQVEVVSG